MSDNADCDGKSFLWFIEGIRDLKQQINRIVTLVSEVSQQLQKTEELKRLAKEEEEKKKEEEEKKKKEEEEKKKLADTSDFSA